MTTIFNSEVFNNEYEKQPEEQEVNTQPATQGFCVDSPSKAEWALSKVKTLYAQREAIQGHYVEMVALAEQWRDAETQKLMPDIQYFESQLRNYAENNLPEGKQSINLINGALKFKKNPISFVHDDEKLLEIAEQQHWTELINIKKSFRWGDYKKRLTVNSDNEVIDTLTGEIMPIQAEYPEASFKVEVK